MSLSSSQLPWFIKKSVISYIGIKVHLLSSENISFRSKLILTHTLSSSMRIIIQLIVMLCSYILNYQTKANKLHAYECMTWCTFSFTILLSMCLYSLLLLNRLCWEMSPFHDRRHTVLIWQGDPHASKLEGSHFGQLPPK